MNLKPEGECKYDALSRKKVMDVISISELT